MKQLLIPVAAFAITATSVSAFNADILQKLELELNEEQLSALEEAKDLREAGDRDEARAVLENSGLEREDLREIKQAVRDYRHEVRETIRAAVEAEDYSAFQVAAAETKLGAAIESEADFEKLVEADALRAAGEGEAAKEIMDELGIEKPDRGYGHGKGSHGGGRAE